MFWFSSHEIKKLQLLVHEIVGEYEISKYSVYWHIYIFLVWKAIQKEMQDVFTIMSSVCDSFI